MQCQPVLLSSHSPKIQSIIDHNPVLLLNSDQTYLLMMTQRMTGTNLVKALKSREVDEAEEGGSRQPTGKPRQVTPKAFHSPQMPNQNTPDQASTL